MEVADVREVWEVTAAKTVCLLPPLLLSVSVETD